MRNLDESAFETETFIGPEVH